MTGTSDDIPRSGMKGWVKALFAVSLTLNLLVFGVVIGAVVSHWDGPRGKPSDHARLRLDPALGPLARALPEPARQAAMAELSARSGPYDARRAALAGQLNDMLTLLRAEPFDAEAFRALFVAQTESWASRAEVGRDVVMSQVAALSPEDRAAFADRIERGFRRALERGAKPRD